LPAPQRYGRVLPRPGRRRAARRRRRGDEGRDDGPLLRRRRGGAGRCGAPRGRGRRRHGRHAIGRLPGRPWAGAPAPAAVPPPRPRLLFHGDRDDVLPVEASSIVKEIAGVGELIVVPNDGHRLAKAGPIIEERLSEWLPEVLGTA